jgi:acetylornithine/succinyldiaminopimelate/putrescine aminotransferase
MAVSACGCRVYFEARCLLPGVGLDRESLAERVICRCLNRGLSFKVTMGRVLTLTPPLTVTGEETDRAVRILDDALLAAWCPGSRPRFRLARCRSAGPIAA